MKYTIKQFQEQFPTDDVCLNSIFEMRFGEREDFKKYYRVTGRKCYAHSETGEQLHPLAGTIFHKSSTPLTLWFHAIFLMSQSKNGVSAKELERHLGVTYKCAWRIAKQIRLLMGSGNDILSGVVEADETYIGGNNKNRHANKKVKNSQGRSCKDKTPVFGMVERGGDVVAKVVTNVKGSTIMPIMRKHVEIGTDLMTDEYGIYNKASKEGYNHQKIEHGAKEYVRGEVHTNTIEGFWGQLKRGITGTYHQISPKYLQNYVDEFSFRYNRRDSDLHIFFHLLNRI